MWCCTEDRVLTWAVPVWEGGVEGLVLLSALGRLLLSEALTGLSQQSGGVPAVMSLQ